MYEATFKIAALVENNEQGQRVFHVLKHGDPVDEAGLFSLVAMIYQQDVYRTLQVGDDLTVTVHLDLPPRDIERTLRFREDGRFEGEALWSRPRICFRSFHRCLSTFVGRCNQVMSSPFLSRCSGSNHM